MISPRAIPNAARPGRPARPVALAILVAGGALCLWLNLPGHLSFDSVVQLAEGHNATFGESGHPPIMSWLLGLGDTLAPGAGLFVAFDSVLIFGALMSLVALGRRAGWLTAGLALGAIAVPQLLIYPAIVWKDVLFAGASTAGFAALAQAARWWRRRVPRYGGLAFALALLSIAAMARQNGLIVLPFAAIAVAWIAARSASRRPILTGLVHGLLFPTLSLAMVVYGSMALSPPSAGPTAAVRGQIGNLQTYDIVRALVLEPHTPLRVLHARAPWFERLLRTRGVAAFSPVRIDPLQPLMEEAGNHSDSGPLIDAQWRDTFLHDPLLYLRVRTQAFQWVFLSPSPDDCVLIFTGIDGPPEEMADVGLELRHTPRDEALADYAMRFASTPVYSHAAYGLVGLALFLPLLRRRSAPDIAVMGMIGAAMAFAAAFAVISIACDYRYLYDLDLAVVAGALYVVATWRDDISDLQSHRRLSAKIAPP